jgi:hypothetical protein
MPDWLFVVTVTEVAIEMKNASEATKAGEDKTKSPAE